MSELHAILSKVLGIPEEHVTDKTAPENTESWDSFNGLMLVSELERHFHVSFTMDEVRAVRCVADIKATLRKHGVPEQAIS